MGKHSEWRKIAKKFRRKRIRQTLASAQHAKEEEERRRRELSPANLELLKKQDEEEQFQEEEEERIRQANHERWLKIEEEAQRQWQQLQKKLAEAREERARQNALIKLEWEKEKARLKELKEAKEREIEEKQRQLRLQQETLEDFIVNGGSTPDHLKIDIESNPNKPTCPFFQKTGACRFREMCSRNHVKPGVSRVLLISNFYSHFSLDIAETEHGDSALEFEHRETYDHFKEFFYDILTEMEQYGKIRQLKVCCNLEPHLRGNVYVEFSTTREAVKSFQIFNGRWYGGKQLNIEFCKIDSWRSAICGLFLKGECPKGGACNFLHVFQNPKRLFSNADRDRHRTPPKRIRNSREDSERRNWRWSESPERISYVYDESPLQKKKCNLRHSSKSSRRKTSEPRRSSSRSHSRSRSKRRRSRKRSNSKRDRS